MKTKKIPVKTSSCLVPSLRGAGAALAALALSAAQADAALVTSLPGSTLYPFPEVNYMGAVPQTVAPGITWTSNVLSPVFGYTYLFFVNGGSWNGLSMIGLNSASGSMSISFATPVAGVGAFINYTTGGSAPRLSIYDSSNTLLETYQPSFTTTGVNQGYFYGFSSLNSNISRFEFSNASIVATNLSVLSGSGVSAVPEPGSILPLGGLLVGGLLIRRRKSGTAA